MPIKVPNNLPAIDTLTKENVFVMTDTRAMTQNIRPLSILILNLMPTKIDTETQLTRLLGNTPLQVELELLQTSTHKAHFTSQEHMIAFYKTFDAVRDNYYDGMIITGAPVELLEFEEVEYWDELCEIMEWTKSHVHSTFHICWGAQAALYYHYGIPKRLLDHKISGVYEHHLDYKNGMLFRGFDDTFYVPHSRNTTTAREDVEAVPELKIIASSDEAGIFAIKSENDRQIFIMGHSEYDGDTLKKEYLRDKEAGLNPKVPENYFPDDDDTKEPIVRWRSCANLLYSNWLNYFVYQSTPYDIREIRREDLTPAPQKRADLTVAKFGGSSLASADRIRKVKAIVEKDPAKCYIVVSAPGKRTASDKKITDQLIEGLDPEKTKGALEQVKKQFRDIINGLGVEGVDLDAEFERIEKNYAAGAGEPYLISRGEYLNAKIIAEYLGYDFVDAKDLIRFDRSGEILEDATRAVVEAVLENHDTAVIPGFYGSDPDGKIVTFTRGGSDITGSLIAEGISADLYENWTDVSGLLMADPKVVKNPLSVPVITYKELRAMSMMGATVMHEDAVTPVRHVGIPVCIRNTDRPDDAGTMIVGNADYYQSPLKISGISGKTGYASILIEKNDLSADYGIRARAGELLGEQEVGILTEIAGMDSLNLIVSESSIDGKVRKITAEMKKATGADRVVIRRGIALLAVVGREMDHSPAIAVRVFDSLASRNINVRMIDHGADGITLMIGVDEKDLNGAIRAIYTEFTRQAIPAAV